MARVKLPRIRKYTFLLFRRYESYVFGRKVYESLRHSRFTALNDDDARTMALEQAADVTGIVFWDAPYSTQCPVVIKRGWASPTGIVGRWACLEAIPGFEEAKDIKLKKEREAQRAHRLLWR